MMYIPNQYMLKQQKTLFFYIYNIKSKYIQIITIITIINEIGFKYK
ncbi:MAG: hypothetical protein PWQ70_635 [Clostridiales bacterium]|nr:hypothetical protein [Clostridiales bacterium]